jgi:RHS repeat-associated protein
MRQIYDASGQVLANTRYDPYGSLMSHSGDATSVFAFAGEQYDAATGLEYLRARYYACAQGRFMTRDVWEGDPNLPMSYNAWGYSYDDPVDLSDPTGMDAPWCDKRQDPIQCYRDWYRPYRVKQDPLFSDWASDLRARDLGLKSPMQPGSSTAVLWALLQEQNQYDDMIRKWVQRYFPLEDNLEVSKWVKRLIARESHFSAGLVMGAGDTGLMQVTDIAYRDVLGKRFPRGTPTPPAGAAAIARADLLDPDTNIEYGVNYLQILWGYVVDQDQDRGWQTKKEEIWPLVLASYNEGIGNIKQYRVDFWNARQRTPTPTLASMLPKGAGTRTPIPVPCPTPLIRTVLWRDIQDRAPTTKEYVKAIMGDWQISPYDDIWKKDK